MKRLSGVALVVLLAGCASIPFSTIWKMSSFSREDLAIIDPAIIGAAVELPENIPLDRDNVALRIEVFEQENNAAPVLEVKANLETQRTGRDVHPQLPLSANNRNWHLLELDAEGITAFREFQREFSKLIERHDDKLTFRISVYGGFGKALERDEPFEASVWLDLDQPDDWFTLIDRHQFDPRELREKTGNEQ